MIYFLLFLPCCLSYVVLHQNDVDRRRGGWMGGWVGVLFLKTALLTNVYSRARSRLSEVRLPHRPQPVSTSTTVVNGNHQ
jgi:hypothetical protein